MEARCKWHTHTPIRVVGDLLWGVGAESSDRRRRVTMKSERTQLCAPGGRARARVRTWNRGKWANGRLCAVTFSPKQRAMETI